MAEGKIQSRQTRALWREDFRNLHEQLDAYYFLQKLKLTSASANIRKMYKQEEDAGAEFLTFFRKQVDFPALPPLTQAYFHAIEILNRSQERFHFEALLQLLQEKGTGFEPEEAMDLYGYALNFTIRKGNQGELDYKAYTGALYRDLLEKGLLLEEGRLLPQTMKNIVVIHCGLGHLDWVDQFIADYQDLLVEGTNPALIRYNRAVLAFFRGEYPQAIALLKEVISQLKDDVFYELDARVYLWKSYFEHYHRLSLEEVDEMEKMYDAFRLFIDRNKKISQTHKLLYRNFIREFKRLLGFRQQEVVPPEEVREYISHVEGLEQTHNKDWFLEKAQDLLVRD